MKKVVLTFTENKPINGKTEQIEHTKELEILWDLSNCVEGIDNFKNSYGIFKVLPPYVVVSDCIQKGRSYFTVTDENLVKAGLRPTNNYLCSM